MLFGIIEWKVEGHNYVHTYIGHGPTWAALCFKENIKRRIRESFCSHITRYLYPHVTAARVVIIF
jgi:hypothetical protein